MATVVAVAQRKGGCGKSTLVVSLAAVASSRALHVATVDVDSQANASRWLLSRELVEGLSRMQTVAALEYPPRREWLEMGSPLTATNVSEKDVLETVLPWCLHRSSIGVDVVPVAPHIHAEDAKHLLLSELPVDLVLVDCPPDVSAPAVRSVLAQADVVVSPVVCEPWAVDATEQIIREIVSVGRRDLIDRGLVRFVVNMRTKCAMHDRFENLLRERWGSLVSPVVISRAVSVAESSLDSSLLTKKTALWKAAEMVWKDIQSKGQKRGAA